MPLIIHPEDEERWINPELHKDEIQQLIKPYDEALMDAYPINNDFLKKDKRDVSILEKGLKIFLQFILLISY